MSLIHCPACGKANPGDFKFCLGCGNDLSAARASFDALASTEPRAGFEPAATLPTVPPAPRTPSPRARGLIHAYTGSQGAKRIIGFAFTLVGLGVFALIGRGLIFDVAILVAGAPTKGTITRVGVISNVEVNGRHPHEVHFQYGGHRGSSSTTDSAVTSGMQAGQSVDIEAVPGWPDAARVRGTSVSVMGWAGIFPLLFTLIGFPLFLSAVRSNRREIRAFRFGTATVGRVTSFGEDTSVKVNGRHPTVLRWEIDVEGKPYKGSLTNMDRHVLAPLIAGGKVAVVYDKDEPGTNTLYVP